MLTSVSQQLFFLSVTMAERREQSEADRTLSSPVGMAVGRGDAN